MSKSLAASQKVMRSYLSELLTDEETVTKPVKEATNKPLEKLLEGVAHTQELPVKTKVTSAKSAKSVKSATPVQAKPVKAKIEPKATVKQQAKTTPQAALTTRKSEAIKASKAKAKEHHSGNFQAMFFDVAGLTVAVPLIELGGIYNADKTTPLMGKPDWFSGVMLHREEKVNVVNTAKWVMPEKCTDELLEKLDYQYVIMLGDSGWGLSAEQLVDTVTLEQEDVKWLSEQSKRPWLAGLVKDRMCALLDVDSLIRLLDEGAGIHQN